MFRISYLVKDEDLVKALHIITPLAINLTIINAPNGEVTVLPPSVLLRGTRTLDLLMTAFSKHNLKAFKSPMFKKIAKEIGLNPASSTYYLNELIKHGRLSRLGRKGRNVSYQVIEQPLLEHK